MSNVGTLITLGIGLFLFLGGIGSLLFGLSIENGNEATPEGKAMEIPRDFFIGLGIFLILMGIIAIAVFLLTIGR